VIQLQAGTTFSGNFILKNKGDYGGRWIILTTSRESELPVSGHRVSPSDAALMPKIVSPNPMSALGTEFYTNQYRLTGNEITSSQPPSNTLYQLVSLGYGETSLDQLPSSIVIDRCYIHGRPDARVDRQLHVALDGLVRLQLRDDNAYMVKSPQRANGGVRRSPIESEIRLDYTQHALSALLNGAAALSAR
jgi:hypothetical protein